MAYAYWVGNKVYVGWTDSAGVPHREPAADAQNLTQGRQEAAELERRARRQRKGLEVELGPDMLFADAAEKWLGQLSKDYRSKETAETYVRLRIVPFLGKKPCRSITRDDVWSMLLKNEEKREAKDRQGRAIVLAPASIATRQKLRGYVHTIFEYLTEDLEVFAGRNPAGGKRMRSKLKAPKRLPRFIPPSELVPLLRAIPEQYRLLFVFAVVTGVRKGELIPLLWSDVRFEERHASISKSRGWDTTKGNRERVVPIPKWLLPVMEDHRTHARSRFVFPNAKGKQHRFDVKLTRKLRTAAKAAGLVTGYQHSCRRKGCGWSEELPDGTPIACPKCRFTSWVEGLPIRYKFKDLRSTFGTLAASQSKDIRFVQQVLGHASVTTTEGHYARALVEDLHQRADGLSLGVESVVSELRVTSGEMRPNVATQGDVEAQQ